MESRDEKVDEFPQLAFLSFLMQTCIRQTLSLREIIYTKHLCSCFSFLLSPPLHHLHCPSVSSTDPSTAEPFCPPVDAAQVHTDTKRHLDTNTGKYINMWMHTNDHIKTSVKFWPQFRNSRNYSSEDTRNCSPVF